MTYRKRPGDALVKSVWEISRLKDYVALIEKLCRSDLFYFRGQPGDFPLRPKLARLICRQGSGILDTERALVHAFRNAAHSYLAHVPENDWDLLAVAQHHGMATRLLDWSKNPLASLWFAVERPAIKRQRFGVVWMLCATPGHILHRPTGSPFDVDEVRIWEPRHVSPRIRAQTGAFTIHPYDSSKGQFNPLEKTHEAAAMLTKIIFAAETFADLRYELDRCGVNAASVYPDIDGLARHIEWFYSYLSDEGPWNSGSVSRVASQNKSRKKRNRSKRN